MTKPTSDYASAHLDGEAEPDIRAWVGTDPAARSELSRYARNDQLLREAVEMALGPVLPNEGVVVPFPARPKRTLYWGAPGLAAAAVVVFAIGFGPYLTGPSPLVSGSGSELKASVALNHALSTARSGFAASAGGGVVTVNLTFKSGNGEYCRMFAAGSKAGHGVGVACLEDQSWRMKAWDPTQAGPSEGYETAGGVDSQVITAAVDKLKVTESLDADAELAAIRSHWSASR